MRSRTTWCRVLFLVLLEILLSDCIFIWFIMQLKIGSLLLKNGLISKVFSTPEEVVGPLRRPNLHLHLRRRADRPEPLRRAESRGPPLEHRSEGAGLGVRVVQRAITGPSSRINV